MKKLLVVGVFFNAALLSATTAQAEDPVEFADPALKLAAETKRGRSP